MNIKGTFFPFWLFFLSEAQTEIPPPLDAPVFSTSTRPAAVAFGGGPPERCGGASVGGWGVSAAAGSQLRPFVCSVLCTSSGTSFGLWFLHDLVNYVYMNDDQ